MIVWIHCMNCDVLYSVVLNPVRHDPNGFYWEAKPNCKCLTHKTMTIYEPYDKAVGWGTKKKPIEVLDYTQRRHDNG